MNPGSLKDDNDTRHDGDFAAWEKELNPGAQHADELERMYGAPAIKDDERNTAQPRQEAASPAEIKSMEGGAAASGSSNEGGFYHPEGESGTATANGDQEAGAASAAALGAAESTDATTIPYKNEDNTGGIRSRLRGQLNRRNGVIGGILVGFLGGGIFLGGLATGPFELTHLSQLLAHNWSKSQSDTGETQNHLLRDVNAIKEKDFRYTRVGLIGAKIANGILAKYEEVGIKFNGYSATGRPTSISIDRGKLAKSFPETESMKPAELQSWLNDKFGVSGEGGFQLDPKTGEIKPLGISQLKAKSIANLISDSRTKLLGDSGAVDALKARSLKKFWGLGSIFHPFSRAIEDKINNRIQAAREARQKGENTPEAAETPDESERIVTENAAAGERAPTESAGVETWTEAHDKANGTMQNVAKSVGAVVGTVWATGCLLRDSGTAIIKVNRDLTALPAAEEATMLLGGGGQVMYGGSDITTDQVGGVVSSFTDRNPQSKTYGKDIWTAVPLQALAGNSNVTGGGANDISPERKQAFEYSATGARLHDIGQGLLDALPITWLNGVLKNIPGVGGVLNEATDPCGIVLGTALIGGAIVIKGVSIATDEDGGASSAALWAITRTIEEGVKLAVGAATMGFIANAIVNANAPPQLAKDAFSGPFGGSLIAYGARAASNLSSAASGAISLANNASTIIGSAGQQEQQQFRSENFFARMFNITDYRSLFGRMSMLVGPSLYSNASSLTSGIQHIGSSLASMFGSLMPGVSAASANTSWTGNYDWGFPQFGIPDTLLNNPEINNPYANGETLGQWLSDNCQDSSGNIDPSNCPSGGHSDNITDRIKACFGNDLTYADDADTGSKVWDVAPVSNFDIDPSSNSYLSADCSDIGPDGGNWSEASADQQTWQRVIMFVHDTSVIKSMDCLGGGSDTSDQSCVDTGMEDSVSSASSSSNDAASTGSVVSGDSITLAKQILKNPNIILGPTAKSDVEATANGQTIMPGPAASGSGSGSDAQTSACQNRTATTLNATLLQAALNIAAKYQYQIGDFVSGHACDTGRHPLGRAFDIFQVNGKTIDGHCTDPDIYNFLKYTTNVMSNLLPNGQFVNGEPINMAGIGSCDPSDNNHNTPSWVPSNINYFYDATDEIHVDVGFAS